MLPGRATAQRRLRSASSEVRAGCPRRRCRRRRARRGCGRRRRSRAGRGRPRAEHLFLHPRGEPGIDDIALGRASSRMPRTSSMRASACRRGRWRPSGAMRPSRSSSALASRTKLKSAASALGVLRSSSRAASKSAERASAMSCSRESGASAAWVSRRGALEVEQPLDRGAGGVEAVEGEVQLLAVLRADEQVADGRRRMALLDELADGEVVALRLRHLLAVDEQVLHVQPVADERLAGGALGLGDLVLVVREDEVLAAGMDVEGAAERGHAHGGALDVPAGPALAPRRRPRGADLRSTSFAPFHRAKSRASAFSYSSASMPPARVARPAPVRMVCASMRASRPYCRER
jgi:hypothetical protein